MSRPALWPLLVLVGFAATACSGSSRTGDAREVVTDGVDEVRADTLPCCKADIARPEPFEPAPERVLEVAEPVDTRVDDAPAEPVAERVESPEAADQPMPDGGNGDSDTALADAGAADTPRDSGTTDLPHDPGADDGPGATDAPFDEEAPADCVPCIDDVPIADDGAVPDDVPGADDAPGTEVADTADARDVADTAEPPLLAGWPTPNAWSWDGSWTPTDGDFPIACLYDDEYFDAHAQADGSPTVILPPGAWDWNDAADDYANWRNFEATLGRFARLDDTAGRHFGWRFVPRHPEAVEFDGPAAYFEGSCGPDILDLAATGTMHSFGAGGLADGPDVLVVGRAYSLDYRTGSSLLGASHDNDLVVAGGTPNADASFDIVTTTFHTGPGADWVFVRDLSRSALDLGNGAGGRTDTLDPADGDDLAVIRGNAHDFRVMGGRGDDTVVWMVDEVRQQELWLGPNFFGGGADGDALWGDPGTDRLVLGIPVDTPIVTAPATPAGALLVMTAGDAYELDLPVQDDPFARYCVTCGVGPGGRRTVILEYHRADGGVFTGYFYVTAFEELQVGLGPDARLYTIDDVHGALVEASGAAVFEPPAWPDEPRATWSALTPPDEVDPFPGPVPLPDRAHLVKAPPGQWPEPNAWSWDGRWAPGPDALPAPCLYDETYFDGHLQPDGWPTEVLPPGDWDWDDAAHDYANWGNFDQNLGHFEALVDPGGDPFGWRFVGNDPAAVDFSGPALYFQGSCGAEILDLGPGGSIASFGEGSLAGGPDVLVFTSSHALDYRTGSDQAAPAPGAPAAGLHGDAPPTSDEADNDLVVAGGEPNPTGDFDVLTTTLHTGPGSDWVFARDVSRSAFDLGNGANGRTDTSDPADGDDLLVLRGNAHDFRVMGGYGHDTVVWYVDEEVQTTLWLGPNLFGGGAHGDALWNDPGVDRLVLVVPADTPIVHQTPTPAGSLLVKDTNGQIWMDAPVQADPFARYCIECGVGPEGRKTVILEYYKADGSVLTGYFYVTAFEELQLGLGPLARVYAIDDVHGDLVPLPEASPFEPPPWPADPRALWIIAP